MSYRGYRIERAEGVQMGHKTNASTGARAGLGTKRKASGWLVTGADGADLKWAGTKKEALAYVDAREG
jgi:hypothetical protein